MTLHFEKIDKSYGKNHALVHFTATLTPGIYALMGPNGSGKSTLINILTDNLKADSGEITYDGENTLKMGVKFREKLGFMPQYPGMYPNFTIEKFLWYMATLKGLKKDDAARQIAEVLEAVELADIPNRKISALSGGMKQRLALAQAVLGDPEILILDEPTAGLDPKQRIAIRNYIAKIALEKIVLIATHVVSDVEYIAKEVIFLKKGQITDLAPAHELAAKIDGKVWEVTCRSEEVAKLQQTYRVINIAQTDTGVTLRVLSETAPEGEAKTVAPTLEDYYLWVFGESGS
jgi:ABC-type multidrug transport system ATPase subunit